MSSSAALVEPAPAAVPAVFEGSTFGATNSNGAAGIKDKGLGLIMGGRDTRSSANASRQQRCAQCNRRPCQHHANHANHAKDNSSPSSSSASPLHQHNSGAVPPQSQKEKEKANGTSHSRTLSQNQTQSQSQSPVTNSSLDQQTNNWYHISHLRPRRNHKLKFRASAASKNDNGADSSNTNSNNTNSDQAMEPPVLSFYGTEPVPLPSRFASIKRNLVAGHEAELEASWKRLLDALRGEVEHIQSQGSNLTPSIDFTDIENPSKTADFARELRRYGVGVVRGVMPKADCDKNVAETVKYLETKHDFKPPPAQDPTCFDFFWSPAQVRTRAHPSVLRAQKFVMSLWDNQADDRMATKFPIVYADRIRIHGAPSSSVANGTDSSPATNGNGNAVGGGTSNTSAASAAAAASAAELLGDFTSSTVIAQVDNGSLERWEPDGYGRGGTYDAVFKGKWEEYNPWDPTGRIGTTPDAYNGHGACSIFRMYQGVLSLNHIEPGLIRLLPSPKLATAYFLLRPFFSPKVKAPEQRDTEAWEAYLDASNWALDKEQSTIIHGAVPGHAQRLTELWHPHLHLRRTLVTIPTLQPGDYILWHPDLAYHITSNDNFSMASVAASRATTPPPDSSAGSAVAGANSTSQVSILVYVPAAPLTQTNALYLARQRKTFQRGHPGPDFDATGSGLGTEASHTGRPGETDIAEVGGSAGLQAMGLAPFDVAPSPAENGNASPAEKEEAKGEEKKKDGDGDVDMDRPNGDAASDSVTQSHAEADLVRLANIILFPENYYYMPKRNGDITPRVKAEKLQEKR